MWLFCHSQLGDSQWNKLTVEARLYILPGRQGQIRYSVSLAIPFIDTMQEQAVVSLTKLQYQLSKIILPTDHILVVNVVHTSYIPQGHSGCAQFPRPFLAGAKRGWARDQTGCMC